MHNLKLNKVFIFIIAAFAAVCAVLSTFVYICFIHYSSDSDRVSDLERINSGGFEEIILSMLPNDNIEAESFEYYRGIHTVKAEHTFQNMYDLSDFLADIDVRTDYICLAIDPVSISKAFGCHASLYGRVYSSTLLSKIRDNTDTQYEILLSCYSLDYWKGLSDADIENAISSYRDFVNIFYGEPNVKIYFMGAEEWLIANPDNYESLLTSNKSVTNNLIALMLKDSEYILSPDIMEYKFQIIRDLTDGFTSEPLLYGYDTSSIADMSDTDIVFFGDSIIGNFNDSTSIPGVVAGMSGAHTYNLGLGGTTATYITNENTYDLIKIVDAFIRKDASGFDDDQQPKQGIEAYLSEHADDSAKNTCFIISYGLNDYFEGLPIDTPYGEADSTCYAGAYKTACRMLTEAYPDCRIILTTPTFCSYYEDGSEMQSEQGGKLADYVNAVIQTASELGVECMDNYSKLGIEASNYTDYLSDGCHPNEAGRYLIGIKILMYLQH